MGVAKKYRNWALIAVVLLLFGTAVASSQYKVPVIMTGLMEQFSMDAGSASWLMSIFTFVGIILAIPTGALAKKYGPKALLLAAGGILLVGSLVGVFAADGTMLIVSRAIEGVAFILVTICGPLAVQKYVAPDKIGSATGIWALWVCLGSVVGGIVTPTVSALFGFVGVWMVYAVFAAVFAVLVAVVVRFADGSDGPEAPQEQVAQEKASYAELLKPNTLLFFLAFLLFNLVLLAMLGFSPTWMQSQGMDASLSGFLSTLPMLLAVISSPLFGTLSDKMGRCKPLYIIGMLAMGPSAFLLLTGSGPALWVGAVIMGLLGLGVPVMALTSFGQVLGKPELMSIGMGFLMLIQSLGQFLGTFLAPIILGANLDQWMTLGVVMCVIGFAGTACVALCKFK
ncbi:CynX/NimT family MFS transporter [Adlercreutzia sp. ZJ473]|uniref:MFS transporter n=1 Tax=Adlercreutzia sp. ZJ473 TaxID=2722822 RepID=UPI0015568657|nr:MFS transporter [Adlercreutzia sp. ZJ473]